ncbi:ABC transporter permease [Conexibacter sp. CPCC 206217]|uniref:ABC transporter permease n=1 Tax=Conexibacter sp. CPCC 206217 TaxID=3064574 RepID=UPI002717203B|nr:ABC transporter permease [Conexibacter sp. CPCC 206217]MDO8213410.1 ABC transporter permease [Conexibacter sp. CPCC 206217]
MPELATTTPDAGKPPAAPAGSKGGAKIDPRYLVRWETLIVGLIIVVLFVGSGLSDKFFSAASFTTGSFDMIEVALIALPMTLVIITGEIDLSVASILGLSSALMGELWNAGLPLELIMPICIAMGAVCGVFNGFLVTQLGLPSLAVTIGTLGLYRGLALVILGDESVTSFPSSWTERAFGTIGGGWFPNVMVIFIVLAVLFAIALHATPFGRSIYAIGANKEAARFSGIRTKRITMSLYVLAGMVAALAGIVMTLRNSTAAANVGVGLELTVVAAVLLGGVSIFGGSGSLFGVILAVFLLGAIQKALLLANGVSSYWIQIVTGVLLVGSVLGPNLVVRAREARARTTRSRAPGAARAATTTTTPRKEEDR